MTLTCPNCGNDRNFLVKTLQMHVVNVEGGRVEVSEESRPAANPSQARRCHSSSGSPSPYSINSTEAVYRGLTSVSQGPALSAMTQGTAE